jgi:dolichol-phosphate mannosyltransferase
VTPLNLQPVVAPDVTIVIPTFNERDRLGALLERLFAACRGDGIVADVIVVDDNSPDGTGLVADQWATRGEIRVIHRTGKLGLGSAVLEGFAIARADVVGVMDADLSHPPELLPTFFRTLLRGNFDIVVGSRYVPGGGVSAWPFSRWVLSRVACVLTRPLTPVRDAMSGFILIRRERLGQFATSVRGFKIGLELIVRSRPRRLAELGYVFVGRSAGESKMTIAEGAGFLRQLGRLYIHVLSASVRRPAYVTIPAGRDLEPLAVPPQ